MKGSEWQAIVAEASKRLPGEIEKGFLRIAGKVQQEAIERHLSGPKMPKGVGSEDGATLQPHTGDLRRSILRKGLKNGEAIVGVRVYTNMVYAAVHEFGHKHVPKRPFLWPAVKKYREEMREFLEKIIKEVLHE